MDKSAGRAEFGDRSIYSGCNGVVEATNHISSVPDLHKMAGTYALDDAYSTGTQPPSGPNHWCFIYRRVRKS